MEAGAKPSTPIRSRPEVVLRQSWQAFKYFLYGLTGHPFVRHSLEMKHDAEALFFVVTFGDFVGVPVMPPVYSLRLLPYVVPKIAKWQRQLARRREFWEKEEYDLHGI